MEDCFIVRNFTSREDGVRRFTGRGGEQRDKGNGDALRWNIIVWRVDLGRRG